MGLLSFLKRPVTKAKVDSAKQPTLMDKLRTSLAEMILGSRIQWDQPIWTDWNTEKAIKDGFKSSTWVFACVTAVAQAASSVGWFVESQDTEGTWHRVDDHPLAILLERPNKTQSRQDMIERITMHMWLAGNSFLYKVREGIEKQDERGFRANGSGVPIELWALNVDLTRPVPTKLGMLSHYVFDYVSRRSEGLDPSDVIHFMFCDPSNQLWGMAPLQAISKVVDTDVESKNWWKVSLQRKWTKDGILTFKENLTDDQYDQATDAMEKQGGSSNARGVMVIGEPATFTPTSMSPQELDWSQSAIRMAIEICAGMRVPPPIVGLYDQATYNNISTARKIFWLDTIVPFLEELRSTLDRALVPDFDPNPQPGIRINFDLSEVEALKEDLKQKTEILKDLHGVGVPVTVGVERLGLDIDLTNIEGADKPWLPSNMVPVESYSVEPSEETAPEEVIPSGDFGTPSSSEGAFPEVSGPLPEPKAYPSTLLGPRTEGTNGKSHTLRR